MVENTSVPDGVDLTGGLECPLSGCLFAVSAAWGRGKKANQGVVEPAIGPGF